MITVGDKFPAFTLQGVNSNNEFVDVSVTEHYDPLKHDYTVIYFYPKDFTFICPTEIAGMDMLVSFKNTTSYQSWWSYRL
jgi:alkyl hydroperoxide reductase subunit AhpC